MITSVAGGDDGGPASSATLFEPFGVAVDGAGDLFIADTSNNRVRKVGPAGVITTVAGTGLPGFSGDGGRATSAALFEPFGVAVDGAGDLFIADNANQRVRKVGPAGVITTVAGIGTNGFSGDGGRATSAALSDPDGLAVDGAGDLFIADHGNSRVRKVNPAGVITTVAGNGTQGFSGDGGRATRAALYGPSGVALDRAGDLFIADSRNSRVRKVDPAGVITTVAGGGTGGDGGPATSAAVDAGGVALDAAGDLFIGGGSRVRKVDRAGVIRTVAGNGTDGFSGDSGPATSATLESSGGLAVDGAGDVFIADTYNNRVRKVDQAGIITTVAGNGSDTFSGDGGRATAATLDDPGGVAVDGAGDLFIADTRNGRVRKVNPARVITTVAAAVGNPGGVAVDGAGDLFIADTGNNLVRKVDPGGVITTVAGCGSPGEGGPPPSHAQ
jgi:sugar lactone lactonase YvrE